MSLRTNSECPYCHKRLLFPNVVQYNVETYGLPVTSISECCGKPFRLSRVTTISVEAYKGPEKEDDWGKEIK